MIKRLFSYTSICLLLLTGNYTAQASKSIIWSQQDIGLFLTLLSNPSSDQTDALIQTIESTWKQHYAIMTIELVYVLKNPVTSFKLITVLQKKTGQNHGYDFNLWYQWLWSRPERLGEGYADFKAKLYSRVDPKFEKYFKRRGNQTDIRMDEVRWGGVPQDGIPPLRQPNMIKATEATYLEKDNVVFGIEVNGEARAYPKRILAWHEMFVDKVGGIDVAGVYCTLCGTMVLYKTNQNGINHDLGTSGFLYRSNKLMYDQRTQSLWNTLQGAPVIGPLVGRGIVLEHLSVVTTTWGEWKKRHPNTQVLSLDTGYKRNYDEGIAYQDYFGSDDLMFNTPYQDNRLNNKDEILALRFLEVPGEQLAISTKFLLENPIYYDAIGEKEFVVLTDKTGGNRVYQAPDQKFSSYDQESTLLGQEGHKWKLQEGQLVRDDGQLLVRLPYHRAFWFGWLAAFPETRLVK